MRVIVISLLIAIHFMAKSFSNEPFCAEPTGEAKDFFTKIETASIQDLLAPFTNNSEFTKVKNQNCESPIYALIHAQRLDVLKALHTETHLYALLENKQYLIDRRYINEWDYRQNPELERWTRYKLEEEEPCVFSHLYGNLEIFKFIGEIQNNEYYHHRSERCSFDEIRRSRPSEEIFFLARVLQGNWPPKDKISLIKSRKLKQEDLTKLLWEASLKSDSETLRAFIKTFKLNVNIKDEDGVSLLMITAKKNASPNTKVLIELGADLNYREPDYEHLNALDYAILWGSPEAAQVLIQAGLDIHQRSYENKNLLELAAERNWPRTTQLLLNAGLSDRILNALELNTYMQKWGCSDEDCIASETVLLDYLSKNLPSDQFSLNRCFLLSVRFGRPDLAQKFLDSGAEKEVLFSKILNEFETSTYEGLHAPYLNIKILMARRKFHAIGLAISNHDLVTLKMLIASGMKVDSPLFQAEQEDWSTTSALVLAMLVMEKQKSDCVFEPGDYTTCQESKMKQSEKIILELLNAGASRNVFITSILDNRQESLRNFARKLGYSRAITNLL